MTQTYDIRKHYYDEGKSITQISRETGFDRKTVRKYIEKENWNLEGFIQERPSIIEPYKPLIDQWLENDKYQRRKQRHTARRIYQRLLEEADGFDASYRTVSNYVKKARHRIYQSSRGYLPLQHIPGEAQVDFGEADFIENGRRFSGAYLVLSFPYSNAGFLQVFGGQTYECLAEGMKAIFEHLGGVPTRIWFDNASSMVSSILKEGERILTDSFSRFINHYGFEAVFCNPNAGNEKGNVENKVGYLRRNYLVPIPEFADIREYNRLMLEQCNQDMQRLHYDKKQLIKDLYKEDEHCFSPLPAVPLDIRSEKPVRVDSYGKITLSGGHHRYSTVPRLAGTHAIAVIRAHDVTILDENLREVVKHRRLFGKEEQESMDWIPYLKQLSRYPTALKYSGIHAMLPDPLKTFLESQNRRGKGETLRVLSDLTRESGFHEAVNTIKRSIEMGRTTPEDIKALHTGQMDRFIYHPQTIRVDPKIPHLEPIQMDTGAYDRMLVTGGTP